MLETEEDVRAILLSSAVDILVSRQKSRIDATALLERAPPHYAKLASLDKSPATETDKALDNAMMTMRHGLASMVSGRVDMEQITQSAASARRAVEAAPDLFMQVTRLKTKDKGTYLHSVSVAGLMAQMAILLEFDEDLIDEIGRAGILHDLGKLLIPNAILNKPGELNAAEKRMIRSHPEIGYRHMKKLGGVSNLILDVCRLHSTLR